MGGLRNKSFAALMGSVQGVSTMWGHVSRLGWVLWISHRLEEVRVHAVDEVKRKGWAVLLEESPADEVQHPDLRATVPHSQHRRQQDSNRASGSRDGKVEQGRLLFSSVEGSSAGKFDSRQEGLPGFLRGLVQANPGS